MKPLIMIALIVVFAAPMAGWAYRDHGRYEASPSVKAFYQPATTMRTRLKMPIRLPVDQHHPVKPVHPIHPGQKPGHPGHKPDRPGHHRPATVWPVTTAVERDPQTIIIMQTPPPEEPQPAPEPPKIWVPPVMDTRTEPGYWDYGVKKVWMGDHWRFEQDLDDRTWVPETQVTYVKQAGYWKFAE